MKFPLEDGKKNGVTAMSIACLRGNVRMVEMLHKAGASLNANSKLGISPLTHAIRSKKLDCVKYLIDNKAEIPKGLI